MRLCQLTQRRYVPVVPGSYTFNQLEIDVYMRSEIFSYEQNNMLLHFSFLQSEFLPFVRLFCDKPRKQVFP